MPIGMNYHMGGRLTCSLYQWQRITSDPMILAWIRGHRLPLLEQPFQISEPKQLMLSNKQNKLISQEVQSMLDMGVIGSVKTVKGQIISNIFLKEKKEKGQYMLTLNLKP